MKISIITVCYNSVATIADTLASVASQIWPEIEHIVIDGSSNDGTQEIIQCHRAGLAHIVSEPDTGIYDAMNKGLRLATGDFVGFLNADDVLADSEVISSLSRLAQQSQVDVIYGDLDYVAQNDLQHVVRRWRSGTFDRRQLAFGWMPPHPTFYVRRSLLTKLGDFDTRFKIAADYDFMLRYLREIDLTVSYLPKLMVRMRSGGVSNGSLKAIWLRNQESYRALKKNDLGGVIALLAKSLRKIDQLLLKDSVGTRARDSGDKT